MTEIDTFIITFAVTFSVTDKKYDGKSNGKSKLSLSRVTKNVTTPLTPYFIACRNDNNGIFSATKKVKYTVTVLCNEVKSNEQCNDSILLKIRSHKA